MKISVNWNKDFTNQDFIDLFKRLKEVTNKEIFTAPEDLVRELVSRYSIDYKDSLRVKIQKDLKIIIKCNFELVSEMKSEIEI